MRANPNTMPDVLTGIQQTQQSLNLAVSQLSSGKRVNLPSDDPSASAQMVRNLAASANIDQYTKNSSSILSQAQMAYSTLSSVLSSLNQSITVVTECANGTLTQTNRDAAAQELQGIISTVVSQANMSFQGSSLFSGTAQTTTPFTADSNSPSGYTYNGNSGINNVAIGDSETVQTNVPGDQIFDHAGASVLGSLTGLLTALKTGTASDISAASVSVTTALNYVGQQRAIYAGTVNQVNAQESYLSQETLTLTSQQTDLIGADVATSATALSQAEVAHSAVLAAAAKTIPNSLLNYLK